MWSILTPRRKVPISTLYLRRHPERGRGIPRRYLEAFATGFCRPSLRWGSGVELRWASQTGKSVFLACDSAAPAGIGRIRNTGHRPVRQTAEWNSAGRTDPEV